MNEVIVGGRAFGAPEVRAIETAMEQRWLTPAAGEKRTAQQLLRSSRVHEGEAEAIALASSRGGNEQMVGSRLSMDLVEDLKLIEKVEQTDRSSTVRKLLRRAVSDWKKEYFARQYGEGRMTMARAAKEAGVSLWEMMDFARQKKIAAHYDLDDLRHDLAVAERGSRRIPHGREIGH